MSQDKGARTVVGWQQRLGASMAGSAVAELATLSICTLRTRFVSDRHSHQARARDVAWQIVRTEGVRALFQAAIPAVTAQMVSMGSKFTLFWAVKEWRQTPTSRAPIDIVNNMLNGAVSGVLGGFMAHPFDVWRSHRQRPEVQFRNEFKQHGWRLLMRGIPATASKNTVLYGMLFPSYELTKHLFSSSPMFSSSVVAAACTTICTTAITQPIEYWKLRRMANQTLVWHNAYRGYFLTLGRALPHFLITTSVIELILDTKRR